MEICNPKHCTGCASCASVCPVGAIQMIKDERGFFIPTVNESLCIHCDKCKKHCHALQNLRGAIPLEVYAAAAKDSALRMTASSGAIIPLLAKTIFACGGAVVGAIFDEKFALYENITDSEEEYFRKGYSRSKYVQSETRDCFIRIRERLDNNSAPLLFVGTPCQNAALRTFLQKDYPQLYCVDFACHGTPSPGVFASYRVYLEKKHHAPLSCVDFRVKKPSWSISSTQYRFQNGKEYLGDMMNDPYNVGFVSNLFLRDSCYECPYACAERCSDITTCDYWGKREVRVYAEEGEQGVSAIMINTKKGKELFERIREALSYQEISFRSVQDGNVRLVHSELEHEGSNAFWADYLRGEDFSLLAKRHCPSLLKQYPLKQRLRMKYNYSPIFKLLRKAKSFLRKNK